MSIGPNWPIVQLSALASARKGSMTGGPFGSDLVSRDYVDSGVPVVRGANLPLTARFSSENFVYVSLSKADSLHLNCAKPGDLVFTQRGTLGQVGVLPGNTPFQRFLISQSQMKMTVDETKACPAFIYYYFRASATVSYIESIALQAGVPHINLGMLRKFPIVAPPLKIQQRLAAVLSAYDDLIENNRRRIALLERMAEQLYREWFVRFRFPGDKKKVKFINGLPQGWRTVPLAKAFQFTGGATPAKDIARNWTDGTINWFTPTDITAADGIFLEQSGMQCTDEGLANCSAKLFPPYSVMMTSRATIGAIGINILPACTNQGFIACIPNERYPLGYLYHWLKLSKSHFFCRCQAEQLFPN